ncbi:DUF4234 domain-containing protein [Acholeplasma granularum]|uniref:DUF4234 domain-containing protein n=1 Tax=Acholeplasma granularum TaxID=264635 RepID=UPI000470CDC8|nr:DUF4234 domain-containing protein [Acholeplasma granularum]
MNNLSTNRGLLVYIFFSVITLGIYPLYIIHAFAKETNIACNNDGKRTSGLLKYILFSIITFGIYSIIWQVMLIERRKSYIETNGKINNITTLFFVLSLLFGWLTFGILTLIAYSKYINQQNIVNAIYNGNKSGIYETPRNGVNKSLEQRLQEIDKLLTSGKINNDEYKELRSKVINTI